MRRRALTSLCPNTLTVRRIAVISRTGGTSTVWRPVLPGSQRKHVRSPPQCSLVVLGVGLVSVELGLVVGGPLGQRAVNVEMPLLAPMGSAVLVANSRRQAPLH